MTGVPTQGATPQSFALVRTGDPAPVQAMTGQGNPYDFSPLPDGGLAFITDTRTLMLRQSGRTRSLLHAGQRLADCGKVTSLYDVATAPDGGIVVQLICDARYALVRLDASGGSPVTILRSGGSVPGWIPTVAYVSGLAIDSLGRIVTIVGSAAPYTSALIRLAQGRDPEVLLTSGDPVGSSTLETFTSGVALSPDGTMGFLARLSDGNAAIVTLKPGSDPEVVLALPEVVVPGPFPVPMRFAPFTAPVLNDAGVVAFTRVTEWTDFGSPRAFEIQRAVDGAIETIVAGGDPAPDGGTLVFMPWDTNLAVDSEGGVLFRAGSSLGSQGSSGWNLNLYRFAGSTSALVERGHATTGGGTFDTLDPNGDPLIGPDGSILFTGYDSVGAAVFALRDGALTAALRPKEIVPEPARFTWLATSGGPFFHQSSGPFMAREGWVVFDALVTGRESGLYARTPDGTIAAIALGGDAAPGGGTFSGYDFSFHTIASNGLVAFLGRVAGVPGDYGQHLFTGFVSGPLHEIVAERDDIGLGAPIQWLLPPSRIDADGVIVIPALLEDGRTALLRRSAGGLQVLVQTGDTLPDGEVFQTVQAASEWIPLAPLLQEDGAVVFTALTAGGRKGVYRIPASGDLASTVRILGDEMQVEGDVLQPLRVQAMAVDSEGRLAFQAVTATEPSPLLATFLSGDGPVPRRLAGPGDVMPHGTDVFGALPRLASVRGGIVHETSAADYAPGSLWFATPADSPGAGPAAFDQRPLDSRGTPAPDGGFFGGGGYGGAGFIGPGPGEPPPPIAFDRLGSDGERYITAVERTMEGAEILTLFDLRPDYDVPIAAAGLDRVVECAGPDGAEVMLDGRSSTDPDRGTLEFTWLAAGETAHGATPSLRLPLGTTTVDLWVRNEQGLVGNDSVTITVRDSVGPTLAVSATPARLVPDGTFVPVSFGIATSDVCDQAPAVTLLSIQTENRPANLARDVAGATYGTDDRVVFLRGRRGGGADGRVYIVTYASTDAAGNRTLGTATVTVPRRPPRTG